MKFEIKKPSPALKFTQTPQQRNRTTRIIVHHYHHERATPQDVHRWHLNNGWLGIGYNFMVDMDGTIWEGRGLNAVGAHAGNNNGDSIGIACQGRYNDHTKAMPDAQFNAYVWLVKHLRGIYGNIPLLRHRDVNATSCPGKYFPWDELQRLEFRGDVVVESSLNQPARTVTLDIFNNVEEISGYIKSGETWVRLTEMGAALGFEVYWDSDRRIAVVDSPDGETQPRIKHHNHPPGGRTVTLDILGDVMEMRGYIENGATWVRLTDFVGALGFGATWCSKRRMSVISKGYSNEQTPLIRVREETQSQAAADLQLLKQITHFEARGEDEKGQILVANVILNRLK